MSTELETLRKENENFRKLLAPFRQRHDKIETIAKKNGKTFHDVMNTLDEIDKKHMEKIIDGSEFSNETTEQKFFWLECYYSGYAQNLMAKIFYDENQNILQSDKNPE